MKNLLFALIMCIILITMLSGCGDGRPETPAASEVSSADPGAPVSSFSEPVSSLPEEKETRPNEFQAPDAYGCYPASEIGFLSGEHTIEELIGRYGAPDRLEGYIISMSSASLGVEAQFGGITYELLVLEEGTMSFDTEGLWDTEGMNGEEPEKFTLTEADKTQKLRVIGVNIVDPSAVLPRGIRMGDDKQSVLGAYPGIEENSEAAIDDSGIAVPYCPDERLGKAPVGSGGDPDSERGAVWYHFGGDGKLIEVSISWINEYLYFD